MRFIVLTMKSHAVPRHIDRPRSFDRDIALHRAMLAFWEYGYETTTIVDLTAAMGITAPSLYSAFGDKRQLFLEAMLYYAGNIDSLARVLACAPTAQEAIRAMLVTAVHGFTGTATPKGCLLASATASGSSASAEVRSAVSAVRQTITACVVARIEHDIAVGHLPATTDSTALGSLFIAIVQGLSVLARDAVPREQLLQIAEHAMAAWPGRQEAGID